MSAPRSLCLSFELDFEGERVTGWLADEQGNDWAFSSWLELLTLIERLIAGARRSAARELVEVATKDAPTRRRKEMVSS